MTRGAGGRPLRCFGLLLLGWIGVRVALQPGEPLLPLKAIAIATAMPGGALIVPIATAAPFRPDADQLHRARLASRGPSARFAILHTVIRDADDTPAPRQDRTIDFLRFLDTALAFANRHHATERDEPGANPVPIPLPTIPPPAAARPDRLRGSGWVFWRPGGMQQSALSSVGRLGGSQAGLRLDYELTPGARHRVAAYARATSALERPAAPEAALGIAVQPLRTVPVTLALERRIALGKGARNAMAVMAVGGFGPTPVVKGIEAEAYAQAGMVGFRRRDGFVDGKLSLLSPVANSPLRIGGAVSGGAQPGVRRLDIGPEVQLRLPLPSVAARLSVEWRERIAGRAAPASGLAVTLATDF